MDRVNHILMIVCVLILFSDVSYAEKNNIKLTVNVSGAIADKGQLIFSLFNSEDDFLKKPIIEIIEKVDSNGGGYFVVSLIYKGVYAVSIAYDEDNNGMLNTGFMGIPTELVGVSNNAKGFFGPPSFEDASFEINESQTIHIKLGAAEE
ncbi:MAG: hypothetical protein DIZ80_09440 [endosymbiont of Galathealinum brachiosum]|uniref:DUF2141 domain-containing protein n=1 Tax=endosymbiont of Galathealinum brachiosum TaxID=2200906 RepID=A0A370DC65_9GAMM|nr:MAG: hypothetical protein DIZ80_09440 [endosymbiont of Galathealinum brachiosum]